MTDRSASDGLDGPDQDYRSQLSMSASPDDVFDALTTLRGLAAWWTPVTGSGLAGGELRFSFGPGHEAVMRVEVAERGVGVRWTNVACHIPEWVGTTVNFELDSTPSGGTTMTFVHAGLTPRLACFNDCKSGWDHFIPSLQAYVETGTGHPWMSAADIARRQARAQLRAANTG